MTPEEQLAREAAPAEAIERFLEQALGWPPASIEVTGQPSGGSSNITLFLRRGDDDLVLRRPPVGDLLPTAHDMLREYRFIRALWGSAVPVAEPVAACEDAGVIGGPFYLMRYVGGVTFGDGIAGRLDTPAERRRIGLELIDGLAALHSVEWATRGLTGRADGYLQRQLARWRGQLKLTEEQSRVIPQLADVTHWIEAHIPESPPATIVHGDYGLHNVIFSSSPPARLLAVLDWEMATLGDPLADVGWLLRDWGIVPARGIRNAGKELSARDGFPSAVELASRYEERSGISVKNLFFYEIFGMWKEVIITEGLYANYLAGTAPNPSVARFEVETPQQVERILERIASD